ncbi:MAG TPA: alpha/beta hydrolase [Solirubrobacterales bacterium]
MSPERDPLEPEHFERSVRGRTLRGEALGEGPPVVLAHGLTATRRYVLHGSRALPRKGFHVASYDARGHGSSDPAPEGEGYGYEFLAADLGEIADEVAGDGRVMLVGHSMGAHTVAAWALANPERVGAAVFAGPATIGLEPPADVLAEWDELADGLEGGIEGFLGVQVRQGLAPEWQEPIQRFTRARLRAHEHLGAVAQALREVPRSVPFDGIGELENLDAPALVVASHDVADPAHPYAVAEAWTEALPNARLISEAEGEAPLAWKGGKLSREIARFAAEAGFAET